MPDIKTREVVKGTIKTLDRTALAGEKMKEAYVQTKEKAETSYQASENSAEEYASDRITHTAEFGIYETGHTATDAVKKTGNMGHDLYQRHKAKKAEEITKVEEPKYRSTKFDTKTAKNGRPLSDEMKTYYRGRSQARKNAKNTAETKRRTARVVKQTQENIKQSHRTIKQTSRAANTVKSAGKETVKSAERTIKTAEQTGKTAVKTSQAAAKAAQRTAQAAAQAARVTAQAVRAAARAAVVAAKAIAHATAVAVKAIISAVQALISAIAAGGWVAVLIIVIICLIALLVGSCFGIFFSSEDTGSEQTMQEVVREINDDYETQLEAIKSNTGYDVLEMSGSRAVWPEVLSIYAVKTTTDPDNPQEVATMDSEKKELLKDIFNDMNDVSARTETKAETIIVETDDGHGNIVETEVTVNRTYLYITVSHKTADEMAEELNFNNDQKEQLASLLDDENNSLWAAVLYGIGASDDAIVTVALSQIGNVGGQPYWSWYGFGSRVEWCACFVSWCANECGYIDAGVIPKFAGCVNGVNWFRERGQWADNSAEPAPGMIIFFDWDNPSGSSGPQDGLSDHVGIVEKVENGRVYTIEGNSGDRCREKSYPLGYYEILGYGIPAY